MVDLALLSLLLDSLLEVFFNLNGSMIRDIIHDFLIHFCHLYRIPI